MSAYRSGGRSDRPGIVAWTERGLPLIAAPIFGAMALVELLKRGDGPDAVCSASPGLHLGAMTTMYALMGLVHLGPWLRRLRPTPPPSP